LVDGIDEAMAELISALRKISKILGDHKATKNSTLSCDIDNRSNGASIIQRPSIKDKETHFYEFRQKILG